MPIKTQGVGELRDKFNGQSPFHSAKYRNKEEALKPVESLETALEIQPSSAESKLNKLESDWLAVLRQRGSEWLGIQPWGLRLASHACYYHPDFITLQNGALTAWEVKGPQFWDDAKVKIKVAAQAYPFMRFVLVTRIDGRWKESEVKP